MATIEIYARHGDWDVGTGSLTGIGEAQAHKLAQHVQLFLAQEEIEPTIISSEATRAQETAAIIADLLGQSYETTIGLGDVTGRATSERWMMGQLAQYLTLPGVICVTHTYQAEKLSRAARNKNTLFFAVDIDELSDGNAYMFHHTRGEVILFRG